MSRSNVLLLKFIEFFIVISWFFFIVYGLYFVVEKHFVYPIKYSEEVNYNANLFCIDKCLIYSFIKVESGFNKNAVSKKGAKGLMQITDSTAKYISSLNGVEEYDLFSPRDNISFGCYYIKYLINKFGNEKTAIVAYNAGEGNVKMWLKNKQYSDDGYTLKSVPFSESREYLEKIIKSYNKYRKIYGKIVDK